VVNLLNEHFKDADSLDYMAWVGLLRSCTAFEAYCRVYTADVQPQRVLELLLLNSQFPHSVCFSVGMLQMELQAIAKSTGIRSVGRAERLAGRLRATLDYAQVDEITTDLHSYLSNIQHQRSEIHTAIQQTYIAYPVETALEVE
jgi:uncharacterized alpha-E superfamily protein